MTGEKCQLPPPGWYCTRRPGHEGPCAALPEVSVENPNEFIDAFRVTRKQVEQAKVWMKSHDEEKHRKSFRHGQRYTGAVGGAYTWQFTGTSIGDIITLRCSCDEEIDLTDYDMF